MVIKATYDATQQEGTKLRIQRLQRLPLLLSEVLPGNNPESS